MKHTLLGTLAALAIMGAGAQRCRVADDAGITARDEGINFKATVRWAQKW